MFISTTRLHGRIGRNTMLSIIMSMLNIGTFVVRDSTKYLEKNKSSQPKGQSSQSGSAHQSCG